MQSSNSADKKISIIIVNFRSDQYLEKCIASLYNFEKEDNFEIIIVNNDQEKKLEKIQTIFSKIKIINNKNNFGFGQAINVGAKNARGEFLFFLNPDSELVETVIPIILKEFEKNLKIAALSPKVIGENGEKQSWIFGKKMNLGQLIKNNFLGDKEEKNEKEKEVDWVSGASMVIRKKDFNEVGGFDEKFFLYFEDMDLCLRLKEKGKKAIYFPLVKIMHIGSGSKMEESSRKKAYYASQDYYFKKHCGGVQAKIVKSCRRIIA